MNSPSPRLEMRRRDSAATNVSASGATITSPIASPRNQTPHSEPNRSHDCIPVRHKLITPIVALTVVLTIAPNTNRPKMSLNRSSDGRNRTNRFSRYAPRRASSVLPVAMPTDAIAGAFVVILAMKAPNAIAGQMRYPNRSTAHNAIPVGGQTTVTCSATNASVSPVFAPTTYTAAVISATPTYLARTGFIEVGNCNASAAMNRWSFQKRFVP